MHDATKFLVVACAVLCLLLAALTVAYAANADRVQAGYRSIDAERVAAVTELRTSVTDQAAVVADKQRRVDELTNQLNLRTSEISQLQSERTALRTDKDRLAAEAASIRSKIDELSATARTQASLIDSYRKEVTDLRNEQFAANRREIELQARNNDLESQVEVLTQTARALREQLAEVQNQVAQGGRGGAGGPAAGSGPTVTEPGFAIRGTVRDVQRGPAGDDLAVVDVGSNAGLRQNMRLMIVRDNRFVANLVIVSVEPRQAVGRVDKLGRDVTVQSGDQVRSRAE